MWEWLKNLFRREPEVEIPEIPLENCHNFWHKEWIVPLNFKESMKELEK